MTSTTLEKIKAYWKGKDKQDATNALLDYYGKDDITKISEEMALSFLDKLKNGEEFLQQHEKEVRRMNNEEIIKKFILTGKAIYELSAMNAESEGLESPDSVTVSATGADGKIIEINIAIKNEEEQKQKAFVNYGPDGWYE